MEFQIDMSDARLIKDKEIERDGGRGGNEGKKNNKRHQNDVAGGRKGRPVSKFVSKSIPKSTQNRGSGPVPAWISGLPPETQNRRK